MSSTVSSPAQVKSHKAGKKIPFPLCPCLGPSWLNPLPFSLLFFIHVYLLPVVFSLPIHLLSPLQSFTHPPTHPTLQDRRAALTCIFLARPSPRFALKRPNYSPELWCPALRLSPAFTGAKLRAHSPECLSLPVLHQPMGGRQLVSRNTRKRCNLPPPSLLCLPLCNCGDLEGGDGAKIYRYNKHGLACRVFI